MGAVVYSAGTGFCEWTITLPASFLFEEKQARNCRAWTWQESLSHADSFLWIRTKNNQKTLDYEYKLA